MNEKIEKSLQIIEQAKSWVTNNLEGNRGHEAYNNLVATRRAIKKKKYALESNPAAAIYGESQVGKSYLVSSLLSAKGEPFSIADHQGVAHHFIEKINPPGNESESTSLVTRFSTAYKPLDAHFPIKAILYTPTDLILTLCDSYYSDLVFGGSANFRWLSEEEITKHLELIKERAEANSSSQNYLSEDDVLDIADYFITLENSERIGYSEFFKITSKVIHKFQPHEWTFVFSILWNHNEHFTHIFKILNQELEKLQYQTEIFLPIESVLYKHGTLLDVKRLNEIYSTPDKTEPEFKATTQFKTTFTQEIREISKNLLCAISAELIFSQPETLISEKPFLSQSDLLDFPGARGRMKKSIDEVENSIMPQLFLRGKVSYLFKKYSTAEKINILLLCAKHTMVAQREMPKIVSTWINNNIGATPEYRENYIQQSKISPLFIVCTWFNVNLAFNPLQDKNDQTGTPLNDRWRQRFVKTLEDELLECDDDKSWFNDWTKNQKSFKNLYLLRDFEKSETPSNIFKGYHSNKREIEEVSIPEYPNFREDLKNSFLNYDIVKKHFENPELSWNAAATINNDGTDLIIQNLSIAAANVNEARNNKIALELETIHQDILNELLKHYRSNDKDREIENAKVLAGKVQFQLDIALAGDKIKDFGFLMKELTISESSVLQLYKSIIDSSDHREIVVSDKFTHFRLAVPPISGDTAESYFQRLCSHYEKNTTELQSEFRMDLEDLDINLDELLAAESDSLIKNNAQQLAEALIDHWPKIVCNDRNKFLLAALGSNSSLDHMIEMYQKVFERTQLSKKIAQNIRQYLDGRARAGLPFELISDISAQILNQCVLSVGFDYLDEADIHDLKEANEKNKLNLSFFNGSKANERSVQELFETMDNQIEILQKNPSELRTLPNFRNYQLWRDRLKIGFVSVCNIPNYDVSANENLNKIIQQLN